MNSSISKDGNFKTLKAVNDINQVLISNSATITNLNNTRLVSTSATITNLYYRNPYFCQLVKNTISTGVSSPKLLDGFSSANPGGFNNVLNNMALNASSAIVIKKAGTYRIVFQGIGDTINYAAEFYLYKNGSIISRTAAPRTQNSPYFGGCCLSICIPLAVNDKLQIYFENDNGDSGGTTEDKYCYFSAEYLGF